MAGRQSYWFFDWADEKGAKTTDDVIRLVRSEAIIEELSARAHSSLDRSQENDSPHAILAGSGIDLSGRYACSDIECRVAQVDQLFRRVWFYFDQVVVADELAIHLLHPEGSAKDEWLSGLADHAQVAMYLREIGAQGLVAFQAKSHRQFCTTHAAEALRTVGLHDLIEHVDDYVIRMRPEIWATVEQSREGKRLHYTHPLLNGLFMVQTVPEDFHDDPDEFACREMVMAHISGLIVDLAVARDLGVPLGTVDPMQREFMAGSAKPPQPSRVAFELQLPILQHAPIRELLRVRSEQAEAFDSFRDALRRAIYERLRVQDDEVGEHALADEINRDLIIPELLNIRRRLVLAQKSLAAKSGIGVAVGTLMTTCGLLTGLIPITVTGLAALGAAATVPAHEYIGKREEIEMSDMYFLWEALKHTK